MYLLQLEKGKTYKAEYWKFGLIKFKVINLRGNSDTIQVEVLDDLWKSNYIKKAVYKIGESVILIKSKFENLNLC